MYVDDYYDYLYSQKLKGSLFSREKKILCEGTGTGNKTRKKQENKAQ